MLFPNAIQDHIVFSSLGDLPPKDTVGGLFGKENAFVGEWARFS